MIMPPAGGREAGPDGAEPLRKCKAPRGARRFSRVGAQ
jgi:hypothetical protein